MCCGETWSWRGKGSEKPWLWRAYAITWGHSNILARLPPKAMSGSSVLLQASFFADIYGPCCHWRTSGSQCCLRPYRWLSQYWSLGPNWSEWPVVPPEVMLMPWPELILMVISASRSCCSWSPHVHQRPVLPPKVTQIVLGLRCCLQPHGYLSTVLSTGLSPLLTSYSTQENRHTPRLGSIVELVLVASCVLRRNDPLSLHPGSDPGLWIRQPQHLPDLWTTGTCQGPVLVITATESPWHRTIAEYLRKALLNV